MNAAGLQVSSEFYGKTATLKHRQRLRDKSGNCRGNILPHSEHSTLKYSGDVLYFYFMIFTLLNSFHFLFTYSTSFELCFWKCFIETPNKIINSCRTNDFDMQRHTKLGRTFRIQTPLHIHTLMHVHTHETYAMYMPNFKANEGTECEVRPSGPINFRLTWLMIL